MTPGQWPPWRVIMDGNISTQPDHPWLKVRASTPPLSPSSAKALVSRSEPPHMGVQSPSQITFPRNSPSASAPAPSQTATTPSPASPTTLQSAFRSKPPQPTGDEGSVRGADISQQLDHPPDAGSKGHDMNPADMLSRQDKGKGKAKDPQGPTDRAAAGRKTEAKAQS
ncbi:hypothetical protein JVT61DRAFT_7910 [Boletus reticuloceps]|uniref:Uncharacterized protein n=1 Tax=Boletus reticuloceps TaxID=495285 RepID=A0A8I2YHI8_9AGAM|nr:hypothetical protein JVT61DRAFT_7910 [Boletus reticuloceps]